MFDSKLTYYVISGILAAIPALIWLLTIFSKTKKRGLQTFIFFSGTLSVIPIFLLQYFLKIFPQFDVAHFIQAEIKDQSIIFILLFIGVGITEEIVKQGFIRFIDRRYLLIETINESIQFSLVSALGFSFIENIFYIFSIWTNLGFAQLFIAYLFRSIFTTCAHLIFSGFFGYYYGIAKFSLNIREQSAAQGKKMFITKILRRVLNMSMTQSFKEQTILKGLMIAIFLHALFDFLLQLNQILPVALFVVIGYLVLRQMLKRRTGHLLLVTDIDSQQTSSMQKKDEDVVVELVGMWFKEKKYVDVMHICERLLKRDPDNKVVQLFKAQALDKMDQQNVYAKILRNIFPKKDKNKSN